jgi:HAD superfamily hydrolase (TIGR01490 family)
MKLALFDFDGTITRKDTFIDFILYATGKLRFVCGMLLLLPVILGYFTKLVGNTRLKKIMLIWFFNNWPYQKFRLVASDYSKRRLSELIRDTALERILWHKSMGHKVVVVSASLEDWLTEWSAKLGLTLIASKLIVQNGVVNKNLVFENCHGDEKERLIKATLDLSLYDYVYAYGDSKGDRAMLALADEKYYRFFK